MKKIPRLLLAAVALLACTAVPANAFEPAEDSPRALSSADFMPAPGEYVVLISEKTFAKKDWRIAAEKFRTHYAGTLVTWCGNDVESARDALKAAHPRYVAVVAEPSEIDRVFVAKLHRISRAMNDDRWGDFLWGIITGGDGATAAEQLAGTQSLRLEHAMGTTNFDQSRFRESFFITDWGAREFIEMKNGVSGGKRTAEPGVEMTELFAKHWKKLCPQYFVSASHATQFNLEMPFGEGLIASAGTHFFRVPKALLSAFAATLGNEPAMLAFEREHKLKKLPDAPGDKIWIAAGNCLAGDVFGSPYSMACTAISAAGVKQLVGYTVPSWFGEMGWGTHSRFFDGCRAEIPCGKGEVRASVAQAWFFTNQLLLAALPEAATRVPVPLSAKDPQGADLRKIGAMLAATGTEISKETLGRFHDRDVVAFYGDPLFSAEFAPNAPTPPKSWVFESGKTSDELFLYVKSSDGAACKAELCLWFPRRIRPETLTLNRIDRNVRPSKSVPAKLVPAVLTENFVIFRELNLAAGEALELRASLAP